MMTPLYRFCSSGVVESGSGVGEGASERAISSVQISIYLLTSWGLQGHVFPCAEFSHCSPLTLFLAWAYYSGAFFFHMGL